MDRLYDCIRRCSEKAVDVMWPGDWLRFRAAIALELGSYAREAGQRPIIIDCEPNDVLFLGLRVRLRRILSDAVEGHKATAFAASANLLKRSILVSRIFFKHKEMIFSLSQRL
jgi:hypothetical protein